MYTPDTFRTEDIPLILQCLEQNPFATLISVVEGQPLVNHLPVMVTQTDPMTLLTHTARANDHWQSMNGRPVWVVFNGPDAYISPTWYINPGVPTWNYLAVHIQAVARIMTEAEEIGNALSTMTARFEPSASNYKVPLENTALLAKIVMIELTVQRIEAKFKLSQNRPEEDRRAVMDALQRQSGSQPMIEWMRRVNNLR